MAPATRPHLRVRRITGLFADAARGLVGKLTTNITIGRLKEKKLINKYWI
jgi:hypothetical protein